MKKIFILFGCLCMLCATATAVTVTDVEGTFRGNLTIGEDNYPSKEIYILPGVESNSVTFVLPDFSYNGAPLGDIVLVNIPISSNGRLTLEDSPLYIRAIDAHVAVSMSSNSSLSASSAQVTLSIDVPDLPAPIPVTFSGARGTGNYDFVNGGFEGTWSNNEPSGWHSFGTATGGMSSFVSGNTGQFTQQSDKRPGSTGKNSARLQSKSMFGVAANGNCTNGQINAGSMSAGDASKNYNFSDPSNSGYNTPFVGNPDSLVFWAKYIPADGDPTNSANKARAHAVITTASRYQDPESGNYSSVKIADAEINYSATSSKGWQRISVPFKYYSVSPSQAAYMLMTFTTNANPGGGTTSGSSVDNIYLDDVEMVYNCRLSSLTMNGAAISFQNGQATLDAPYSDSDYLFVAKSNGKAAKAFIGCSAATNQIYVYVVAHNYAQAKNYTLYTIQMAEPEDVGPGDTQFAYSATTCDNEPYSDDLFQGLTETGVYTTTIPNVGGGDSIITLSLSVLPSYLFTEEQSTAEQQFDWRGKHLENLEYTTEPYIFYDSLKSTLGCDSVYRLSLYVTAVPRTYGEYTAYVCEGDSVMFNGVYYKEAFSGDILLDKPNQYGGDSLVHLTIQIAPKYRIEEYLTIRQGEEKEWEGNPLDKMPAGMMTMKTTFLSIYDCDSTRVLHLTVLPTTKPWSGSETVMLNEVCGRFDGELVIDGAIYPEKAVYVLPGTIDSTVTFVLPDFSYNGGKLGNIVIPNIDMTAYGQLLLEDRALYLDTIAERAKVTMINGLKEGKETYYSLLSASQAQVVLYIEAPSLPQGILVFFRGVAEHNKNYNLANGGFEGSWTNNEPGGWHSFGTATGGMSMFVKDNTFQFVPSMDIRPGSNGQQSALLSSTRLLEVAANGNCTNGQINAGSSTAQEATKNYNFSDPMNEGFNTPFHGRPDSVVFWAKYQPADRNVNNEVNKARMSTIITTDARYQDPEDADSYSDVKLAAAVVNYAATPDMGWQRVSVPFTYYPAAAQNQPAFILTTFTTNMVPGGGSTYQNKQRKNVCDSVYLDDVQMVYNKQLGAFSIDEEQLAFANHVAQVSDTYCDDCAQFAASANGVSAQTFIAFDEAHKCIYIYVIADDYAQSNAYSLYRVEFSDSQTGDLHPINPQGIDETIFKSSNPQIFKFIKDGNLYIRCGEMWFNASGARVK